jgi:hypothetical protein
LPYVASPRRRWPRKSSDESHRFLRDATRSNPIVLAIIIACMCGRFTLRNPARDMVEIFELLREPDLTPRFNIAPTQQVLVVRSANKARGLHGRAWPSLSLGQCFSLTNSSGPATQPSGTSGFAQRNRFAQQNVRLHNGTSLCYLSGSFGRGLLKIDVAVAVASLAPPVVMATRRVTLAQALVDSGSLANRTNGLGNRCFAYFPRQFVPGLV